MEIVFYKFVDGTCPVKDFIRSLDVTMKAKTLKTIELLENSGTVLRNHIRRVHVMYAIHKDTYSYDGRNKEV